MRSPPVLGFQGYQVATLPSTMSFTTILQVATATRSSTRAVGLSWSTRISLPTADRPSSHPSFALIAVTTHDRAVMPSLPGLRPLSLRAARAAAERGVGGKGGDGHRGPWRQGGARGAQGTSIVETARGAEAAVGMTAPATASTAGGGRGEVMGEGDVGDVNSDSITRGITVTATHVVRPVRSIHSSSRTGITVKVPFVAVPLPTVIPTGADPASGPDAASACLSVARFGIGFNVTESMTMTLADSASKQGVVPTIDNVSAVPKLGSSPPVPALLIVPHVIPAPFPVILTFIWAPTVTGRFGLGLRWPALRGVVRATSPRPSGGIPRDHPTGEGAAVGGGPVAEGTTTMHISMHIQRAHVPSRGRSAIGSPKAQPEGRAVPQLHISAAIVVRCAPGGEGDHVPP